MSLKSMKVELENGIVRPIGPETLPPKARGFLTLEEITLLGPATTCGELAERLRRMKRLPPEEAEAFAKDIEDARANLLPLKSAWD